jgi:hypothetical protein
MASGLIVWTELTTGFLGRTVKGSYSVSRDGLVIVKIVGGGEKTTQLDGSPARFIAERLLRELAAEGKV